MVHELPNIFIETAKIALHLEERPRVQDGGFDLQPVAYNPGVGQQLSELLNQDLSREYQAIIAYVNYSQVLKGAQYMQIAQELEKHAAEELQHALTIANQIDYLGGMPTVTPQPVKTS